MLSKLNEFMLSISPDIYFYLGYAAGAVVLLAIIIVMIYDFLTSMSEKLNTTRLRALFMILTFPITAPLYLLGKLLKPIYIFLKPYLIDFWFLLVGLLKILIHIIKSIIRLGKNNSYDDPEVDVPMLLIIIKSFEEQLSESEEMRRKIRDAVVASNGGSLDLMSLYEEIEKILYGLFDDIDFEKEHIDKLRVEKIVKTSAKRIHEMLFDDLLNDSNSTILDINEDEIPF